MTQRELLTEELLARLLVEAKDAHVEYEKQTGEYDEDWPRWYARHMLERLEEMETAQKEDVPTG